MIHSRHHSSLKSLASNFPGKIITCKIENKDWICGPQFIQFIPPEIGTGPSPPELVIQQPLPYPGLGTTSFGVFRSDFYVIDRWFCAQRQFFKRNCVVLARCFQINCGQQHDMSAVAAGTVQETCHLSLVLLNQVARPIALYCVAKSQILI